MTATLAAGGVAMADHTKEDAQETTAKLEAILHPPPKRAHHAKPKAQPSQAQAQPQSHDDASVASTTKRVPVLVVDPLYSLIVHAWSIPFDPQERQAHLRDIPKNAKELDAHLRRLDAALRAH